VVAATADRAHWSAQDLHQRMEFGLRCAYAHGTMAVRTHVDSNGAQGDISWPVIARLRESWRGRIALQAVGMVSIESYLSPQAEQFAQVMARHGGLLGGSTRLLANDPDNARLRASVDRLFQLAAQYDLDVDVHVDETADPASNTLADVAEAAIRHRYQGRVTAGHCCSLAMQSQGVADRTLDLCGQAQLAIVSLPMCNLYLQGRERDRTPRWRGVTLAHEIAARGIPLAFASDNCRDPFFAFGDHDMLEVFNQSVRIAQLDLPYAPWPAAVSTTPASVMKLESRMLRAGGPADLILFRARTMSELLSRPQWDRAVLRDGRAIDTTLPDYRELDALHPALEA
jgi:cytosine deaminase